MTSIKADLGGYLKEQRQGAKLTLRQLADLAGVSNPYLSQIERGLKKPSAEILQSLAKGLRISAESLYVRAGILDEQDELQVETKAAILADLGISERQKRVLLDIYDSFCAENARAAAHAEPEAAAATATTARAAAKATKASSKRSAGRSSRTTKKTAAKKATAKTTRRTTPKGTS